MPSLTQLWQIFHVTNCKHTTPPKNKFVAIVHVDSDALGVFINTRISNWFRSHPDLLVCETTILAAEHSFLSYDSYVDCQRLYPFTDSELVEYLGPVSAEAKTDILTAIQLCKTIERKYKRAILTRENWPPKTQ